MKPFVYIASAYTKGDTCINAHFQCKIFDELMNDGIVWPYAPLLSHFQHTLYPRHYQDWIDYDKAIIPRMDAVLRLNTEFKALNYFMAESSGADGEVKLAEELNIPVFYRISDLYRHFQNQGGM